MGLFTSKREPGQLGYELGVCVWRFTDPDPRPGLMIYAAPDGLAADSIARLVFAEIAADETLRFSYLRDVGERTIIRRSPRLLLRFTPADPASVAGGRPQRLYFDERVTVSQRRACRAVWPHLRQESA